jgi:hypothetical protein
MDFQFSSFVNFSAGKDALRWCEFVCVLFERPQRG